MRGLRSLVPPPHATGAVHALKRSSFRLRLGDGIFVARPAEWVWRTMTCGTVAGIRGKPARMNRKPLVAAFLWAIFVVLAVHLLQFPGSVPDFERASGGGKLLDVMPSFSVDTIYSRIEQYGASGRRNYFLRNLSVDLILPLSLLPFLFLLMRHAISHLSPGRIARASLLSIPFAYVGFDLAENASVLALLASYPHRLTTLPAVLPFLTVIKRAASMLAIFLPLLILAFAGLRTWRRPRLVGLRR